MTYKHARSAVALLSLAGLLAAGVAYAATPTLLLSSMNGGSVQINASGDANASVVLYNATLGTQAGTLGTTNSGGYFSTTINGSSYGISTGQSVYIIVNGLQSTTQVWPSPSGTPTLSQTTVTLGLGQSLSVYSQGSSAAVYMASNANPSVAMVQTNGTQITITANQIGSTNASICYTGTASGCATLVVNVQTGSVLSFSQNNFTIGIGQGTTATVTGGSGSYSITNNSSPNVASAVLGGNTITITPAALGSTNVTVCDTNGNCGTLAITVGSNTNGSLSFSTTNPSLAVGQIFSVTISGGSGYYVTGNSNPNAASQSVNGSTLTISGLTNGATTITVCSASNGCGSVYATIGGASTGQVIFGTTNPTIAVGQSMNISLSGGSSYSLSSNANASIAQASITGSTLLLYGQSTGSDLLTICATGGSCNTMYVSVTGQATSAQNTSSNTLLAAIQSMQSQLAQLVEQIKSMTTTLTQLAKTVTTNNAGTASGSSAFTFTQFLNAGAEGPEVTALQKYLTQKGFYSGSITGFYGALTEAAVQKYQKAHNIDPAGYVGPSTRAALNAGQ